MSEKPAGVKAKRGTQQVSEHNEPEAIKAVVSVIRNVAPEGRHVTPGEAQPKGITFGAPVVFPAAHILFDLETRINRSANWDESRRG